jgi:hypothetical protein
MILHELCARNHKSTYENIRKIAKTTFNVNKLGNGLAGRSLKLAGGYTICLEKDDCVHLFYISLILRRLSDVKFFTLRGTGRRVKI